MHTGGTPLVFDPNIISHNSKLQYLASFSEDDFRDRVVRPLFRRLSFQGGNELCGKDEEGKDAVFVATDPLGTRQVYVVQTKKGNLNLASKAHENLITAVTQCRTALATKVRIPGEKQKTLPSYVILCASGSINKHARDHIIEELQTQHIEFKDAEDVIPLVDRHLPELWYGIDADRAPYLRALMTSLLRSADCLAVEELTGEGNAIAPITDDTFVALYVHRFTSKVVHKDGETSTEPSIDEIPIQQVLTRPDKLVHIVGAPGSGKTTALYRLAFSLANRPASELKHHVLPVILKARNIAESPHALLQDVAANTAALTPSRKPCFSDEDLRSGTVIVMVDALDEAPYEKRQEVINKIIQFHLLYPQCRVILTSRDYESILSLGNATSFTRYTITPLDTGQAEKLLNHLKGGKALTKRAAAELVRQLHDVHGLELNPLLITVFIATADFSRRDIPANITELFKKFTELMLGRWDTRRGLAQQYQYTLKDFLLKRLAFHMHSRGQSSIGLAEAKLLVSETLASTGHEADQAVLWDEIATRSGLIVVDHDRLAFKHMLLQEFFAGRGVSDLGFFESVMSQEWWKHPLIFYFGEHADSPADLMRLVKYASTLTGFELYRAAVAIGLCIQSCFLSDVRTKYEAMGWVIDGLSRSKDAFSEQVSKSSRYPVMQFIEYYIYARDSVACETYAKEALRALDDPAPADENHRFWYIVSLIESGHLDLAVSHAGRFKPEDRRLLLAIQMGCFLAAHLRITSPEDKKRAAAIARQIAPRIEDLAEEVMKEFKTLLLEVRKGKVKALPMPLHQEETEER